MTAPALPFGDYGSPCLDPRHGVFVAVADLAACRECDMCGGCETHEGCLTDLNHLDWFLMFASPGETPCGQQRTLYGSEVFTCAKPVGHGGELHMARTGDGWPNTRTRQP